jgi:hypothetical protein
MRPIPLGEVETIFRASHAHLDPTQNSALLSFSTAFITNEYLCSIVRGPSSQRFPAICGHCLMATKPCKQGGGDNYLRRFASLARLASLAFQEISRRRFFVSAAARAFPHLLRNSVSGSVICGRYTMLAITGSVALWVRGENDGRFGDGDFYCFSSVKNAK